LYALHFVVSEVTVEPLFASGFLARSAHCGTTRRKPVDVVRTLCVLTANQKPWLLMMPKGRTLPPVGSGEPLASLADATLARLRINRFRRYAS